MRASCSGEIKIGARSSFFLRDFSLLFFRARKRERERVLALRAALTSSTGFRAQSADSREEFVLWPEERFLNRDWYFSGEEDEALGYRMWVMDKTGS